MLLKKALAVVPIEGHEILSRHNGLHVTIREHKTSHSGTLAQETPCVTNTIIKLHRSYLYLFSSLPLHKTGLPIVYTSSLWWSQQKGTTTMFLVNRFLICGSQCCWSIIPKHDSCLLFSRDVYMPYYKLYVTIYAVRARGGAVGWSNVLQAGRSRVRFPMVSEFFIDLILPAAIWPLIRLSL